MDLGSDWQQDAACYNAYPEVDMLAIGKGHLTAPLIEAYCDHCSVVLDCLNYAEKMEAEAVGIWGGMYFKDNAVASRQSRSLKKRKEAIDAQRTRLEQRVYSR